MRSVNPSTGAVMTSYPEPDADTVVGIIARAADRFRSWRAESTATRAAVLRRVADALRERTEALAGLMAREMGKPVTEGRAEAEKCAWVCEHYAEHAEGYLAREAVDGLEGARAFVAYRPLGVVLAVMPWNFPLWQVFRCAAPAIMAGDTVLLKHASNVPGCATAIAALFEAAKAPEGVFATVLVPSSRIDELVSHRAVRAITLTGSTSAGRKLAASAGKHLKPTVLELGGSDPYVVLEDADVERAVEVCVKARMINNGQSCIAAKRFIVVDAVYDVFERRFLDRVRRISMGDPLDPETTLGPMAREDLRDALHAQVTRSVDAGARLLAGGVVPELPGWWYPATVLGDVRPGMAAFDEETFGPVAALCRARDEADAIRLANASPFGLGAAVFTRDAARGQRIAEEELDAGCCFVNAQVKSDPRVPFGGVNDSGYGRELGAHGIRELCNVKTVWVDDPA